MGHGSIRVGGFELRYTVEGEGNPAIVVGSSVYYPRTFSQNLRQHLKLICMDHRGFGKALEPFTTADFELDVLVDDIEALRQSLGLGQIIIVGHSGQGYMALAYARKYPQHVSHIILIGMSPDSSLASFQAADQYLDESVAPERKALLAENMARLNAEIEADPSSAFITRSLLSAPRIWYDYTYDSAWLWQGVDVIPEMFDYVWGHLFRDYDITGFVGELQQPVLVMLGRYDYWNPPHLWEAVRPHFRDLRIRVFEQSGHTPQLEQPDDFNRELLAWLAQKS